MRIKMISSHTTLSSSHIKIKIQKKPRYVYKCKPYNKIPPMGIESDCSFTVTSLDKRWKCAFLSERDVCSVHERGQQPKNVWYRRPEESDRVLIKSMGKKQIPPVSKWFRGTAVIIYGEGQGCAQRGASLNGSR